eukprot:TRINITY_DN8553_c0_g1_i1.p1 TRINITY_DN8553_c0_g1~~TRINITY_DN8553_c0_g1_i1.p1  ORF type:complete len:283 (-),score=33.08 TRINITY_DN8553_c0_g1_i1:41-889(-)
MYPYPYPPGDTSSPMYSYHPPGLYGPPHSHQQPVSTAYPLPRIPLSSPHAEKDGIRTVYVTNLPSDTTFREIHNLFRLSCPGFEACKFGKDRADGQVKCAFASFTDRASALRAVQTLNRYRFDPNLPDLLLRVEFAKADDRYLTSRTLRISGEPDHSLAPRPLRNSDREPATSSLVNNDLSFSRDASESAGSPPPCATLFVSGFHSVTQEDLKPLFEDTTGFVRFAMGKDGRHAFVSYVDILTSTSALIALNGTKVGHSGSLLSITYAKKSVSPPIVSSGQM